jgi:glycosyltransferase involved in cell wall biosynthesis
MKVLYDHQMFSRQKYGGITKYFSEMISNIPAEHQFDISLLCSDNHYLNSKYNFFRKKNILPNKEFRGKYTLRKITYRLNKYCSKRCIVKGDFDLFHPTFYDDYFLEILHKPYVITVHDLIAFKFKDPLNEFTSIRPKMKQTIEKATRIIAVSENTKKDITDIFNISPEKIDVIYHGCNMPVVSKQVKQYGRYILFVGLRDGYKNFKTFIEAVSVLLAKEKDLKLICVGKPFTDEEVSSFIDFDIANQVTAVSVGDEELSTLYANALVFVYPSLYEGFGMPILEAFANDCPICLSNASCFPEIAGNAGVYFDPGNYKSILEAIEKVIYDKNLALDLAIKGKARLTNFSWQRAAEETVLTYKKALQTVTAATQEKIVQIQFSTESGARSALRLQNAFVKFNITSSIVSLQLGAADLSNTTYLDKKQRLISRIDAKIQSYLLKKGKKEFGLFSYPVLGTDISQMPQLKEADIIYIHWALYGFLNFNSLHAIAKLNKPVVIVMHDMWNITGGCHYSFTCDKYITGCSNCQVFPGNKINDLSAIEFKKKIRLYSSYNNFYFVSPSMWLYNCAKEALLTKEKPVFYIPNVLDNTLFKPFDKQVAKKILNIGNAETVIAFGAVSVSSPYKGWPYLQKALQLLWQDEAYKDIVVLIFGSGQNKEIADSIPFKTKFMGFLGDEYSTMLVYNAADVFIVPSLADNQPTTVQESLACGTPVVGFNVGGIPDMIRHKENGYLAKYKDAEDVCNGVKFCLENNMKGYMLPSFEPAATIKKHMELFEYIKHNKN